METLKITGDDSSPDVYLDKERDIFIINGRSLPEDAIAVYAPIIKWFDTYIESPNANTLLDIRFEYINSSSIKQIAKLLALLQKIKDKGFGIKVKWHYAEEDVDTMQYGERLAKIINYPIVLQAETPTSSK